MKLPALTDAQRSDLTDPRSDFTAEDRVGIAMCYMVEAGNSAKAAERATKMLGKEVPAGNIRQWTRRTWWPLAEALGKQILQQDLENKYTRFLHRTEKKLMERLEKGDVRVTKDGDKVFVPVSFRDLIGGHAIISDKRAMIRGEPTSRKEDTGVELLMRLMDQLQARGEQRVKASSIPGEYEIVETVVEIENGESSSRDD